MIQFTVDTYQPSDFPVIQNGSILPVRLKGHGQIGNAEVINLENKRYTLRFELDEQVSWDLYPTITWHSTNGIIDTFPFVSLSDDSIYESYVRTIGKQLKM